MVCDVEELGKCELCGKVGEEWREVDGFQGKYAVSDRGRVRSFTKIKRGRLIVPNVSERNCYIRYGLCDSFTRHQTLRMAHRLVLITFIGRPESTDSQASHIDGINTHNCLTNLLWESEKANKKRMVLHGTRVQGERVSLSKLSECDIPVIRRMFSSGVRAPELGRIFNVTSANILYIVRRHTWKHVH